jgi:hypothetical protein
MEQKLLLPELLLNGAALVGIATWPWNTPFPINFHVSLFLRIMKLRGWYETWRKGKRRKKEPFLLLQACSRSGTNKAFFVWLSLFQEVISGANRVNRANINQREGDCAEMRELEK